ncbi:MAG TPA: FIST N-terminal domain-containing protein [Acidimicrobiia bacterium]|nr:FIST N-terminal domain-containing protein [Acidimicrobiia bacterium]
MNVVPRCAAALSRHPVPVEALGEVAGELLEQFGGERPDLVVVFASVHHHGAFEDLVRGLRRLLEPEALIGTVAAGIAGGTREIEEEPALSVFAATLGEGAARGFLLGADHDGDEITITGWPSDLPSGSALLVLADPYSFPVAEFLRGCDRDGVIVAGGLASAAVRPGGNRLALDDRVVTDGAVAVALDASIIVHTIVSQGCRPVGAPLTVTAADGTLVAQLGGQPALDRLREVVADASDADRELLRAGVHVGVVVDEHRMEFGRGDFLVRNVLGADRDRGALAIGERVEIGQTMQFHVRDAASADDDLRALLAGRRADGALLFTCNGRGARFFGVADHDTGVVDELLGPIPLAGMFCAGEIGPVGHRSFVHGFTASVVLFGAG